MILVSSLGVSAWRLSSSLIAPRPLIEIIPQDDRDALRAHGHLEMGAPWTRAEQRFVHVWVLQLMNDTVSGTGSPGMVWSGGHSAGNAKQSPGAGRRLERGWQLGSYWKQ
jgi:hypothetical protein